LLEGYSSIGIELSKYYADAATARIETALSGVADSDSDMGTTVDDESDAA